MGHREILVRALVGLAGASAVNLLLLGVTFYFGTIPDAPRAGEFDGQDKVVHALFFAVLAAAHAWFFRAYAAGKVEKRPVLRAFLTASAVGALLEVVQAFLPHRSAELLDFVADALGAAFGAWSFERAARFFNRALPPSARRAGLEEAHGP